MKFELEKYKALKIILQILPMWRLMREGWFLNPQVNYPDPTLHEEELISTNENCILKIHFEYILFVQFQELLISS